MNKNRKYTENFRDAKKLYKLKTGHEFKDRENHYNYGITIFKLKIMRTPTRTHFVGTYMEWLNL